MKVKEELHHDLNNVELGCQLTCCCRWLIWRCCWGCCCCCGLWLEEALGTFSWWQWSWRKGVLNISKSLPWQSAPLSFLCKFVHHTFQLWVNLQSKKHQATTLKRSQTQTATFWPLRHTDVSSAKNTLWLPRIHVAAKQLSRLIHPIFPRNLRRRPVFVSQVKVKVINSSHISRNVGRRPVFVYQLSKSESHQLVPYFPAPRRALFLLPHKVKVELIISSPFSPQLGEPCFCCPVKWEVMDLQVMERRVGATP